MDTPDKFCCPCVEDATKALERCLDMLEYASSEFGIVDMDFIYKELPALLARLKRSPATVNRNPGE